MRRKRIRIAKSKILGGDVKSAEYIKSMGHLLLGVLLFRVSIRNATIFSSLRLAALYPVRLFSWLFSKSTRELARTNFKWLMMEAPPQSAEFFSGILLIIWGTWLLTLPGIFDLSEAYSMFSFMPEILWGGLSIIIGIMRIITVLVCDKKARTKVSYLSAIFWYLVAVAFITSSVRTTATPTYTLIASLELWIFFRLARALSAESDDG